jgi:CDP-diacylglycerol---glycerol-3-phosphate 3-phosphatidyltransferase
LASLGATANGVTIAAAILSLLLGGAIALWPESAWPLLILPAFLFIRMGLNAVDGMLAREHGQQSRVGAILNELGDVVSDAGLYLPLGLVAAFHAELMVVIVVLAVISEMTGVLGLQVGSARRYDGPMGKSDRAFVFGALALWIGLGGSGGLWLDGVLILIAFLLAVTIVRRAAGALREGS